MLQRFQLQSVECLGPGRPIIFFFSEGLSRDRSWGQNDLKVDGNVEDFVPLNIWIVAALAIPCRTGK